MTKTHLIISLIGGIIITYSLAIAESILIVGSHEVGLPLRFGYSTFFGESTTNYLILIIDVIFWFAMVSFVKYKILKSRK